MSDRDILIRIWWSVWLLGLVNLIATAALLAVVASR